MTEKYFGPVPNDVVMYCYCIYIIIIIYQSLIIRNNDKNNNNKHYYLIVTIISLFSKTIYYCQIIYKIHNLII